jgi:predicted DNA repair protein MutK
MWDSELPHLFVDLATLLDDLRIEGFHATRETAIVLEDGEDDLAIIEQPVVTAAATPSLPPHPLPHLIANARGQRRRLPVALAA